MNDPRNSALTAEADPGALLAAAVAASYNSVVITTASLDAPGPRII